MVGQKINKETFCFQHELTKEDIARIEKLRDLEMRWTSIDKLIKELKFDDNENLIQWLRRQSTNKVQHHENKPVHSLTVIKSYSFDPVGQKAFVALCPLLTGREFNWWD